MNRATRRRSRPFLSTLTLCLLGLLSLLPPAWAQRGDVEGEAQPENWRRYDVPPAPVLSPQQALESFRVAPGFRVEVVAAEPLVVDPVAVAWDARGRLWVVEMRGFMPNVDGVGEQEPVGQVVVLQDLDRDGTMDKSTVFMDGLVNPRAIAVVRGGVLIGEPPHLWFGADLDGDLRCDRKEEVARYGDPDPDLLEHTENGLLWALDNWIYNAKSSRRFRFHQGKILEEPTAFRGQWGIAQDNQGRLYFNSNSRYLAADLFPSAYLERNPAGWPKTGNERRAGVYERVVEDESVHTIRVNPGINRGYRRHMLRQDGRLRVTTAVSGLEIYRGHQFPSRYVGDAFVPEPGGNVVSHFDLWDEGVEIQARKELYDDPTWGQREFLASTDERFRPVDCAVGPDGTLLVVDMYRGILQHRRYVTTYLRKQILERELQVPVGMGRLYRVVWEGEAAQLPPEPWLDTSAQRLAALSHPNGWWRDTAQRLLVENPDPAAVEELRRLVVRSDDSSPLGRLHALHTLAGLEATDGDTVRQALTDPDPGVRTAALRTGESLLETEARSQILPLLLSLARDPDPQVRLQAMFTLGELGDEPTARQALVDLLHREIQSPYHRQAALSGLAEAELETLEGLLAHLAESHPSQGPSPQAASQPSASTGYPEMLQALTAAALRRDPGFLDRILRRLRGGAADGPGSGRLLSSHQLALIDGVLAVAEEGENGLSASDFLPSRFEGPFESKAVAEGMAALVKVLTASARLPPLAPLTRRQLRLLKRGERLYVVCRACHQADGRGQAGDAPSLVSSSWVLEDEERLIRIVLHGMQGPLVINNEEWDTVMPGHRKDRNFTNKNVAGLLTYLRRQWGHRASAVDPQTVARVRRETKGRRLPWTVEELLALE